MARRSLRNAANATDTAPWRWAWTGASLGLLLALVVWAPARWLAAGLAQASQGQVQLADPRGTLWDGSAQLVLAGGAGSRDSTALPERLRWRIRPSGLGVSAQLRAECCMAQPLQVQAAARWGGAHISLADSQSHWPAPLLAGLGAPWNTLQPEGQLTLNTQGLVVELNAGRLVLAGQARLEAIDMASRLSTLKPMGSYRVTLTGGNPNTLQLETLAGSLQLTGSGQWVGNRLRFDGVATAAPDRVDALSNLLNILGRRDGARAIIKVG
ncbi:general secretion pathway protein N [Rhodoferax sp. OV413]|uniref:type II secretion system protein N n=1 Tax=Rhodoferax sp. OV413 TaxID=1855285 RepID=UPI000887D303|nr:type II secretion system protein N [Rhodoferax sp. OV413]SDP92114.1 general secretion pathway protein N [Rhodoferax sp. OV413]